MVECPGIPISLVKKNCVILLLDLQGTSLNGMDLHLHVTFYHIETDYWPSSVRVCGFWFLPVEWQFSCKSCKEISVIQLDQKDDELCSTHFRLQSFLKARDSEPIIFIGLSSVGRQVRSLSYH